MRKVKNCFLYHFAKSPFAFFSLSLSFCFNSFALVLFWNISLSMGERTQKFWPGRMVPGPWLGLFSVKIVVLWGRKCYREIVTYEVIMEFLPCCEIFVQDEHGTAWSYRNLTTRTCCYPWIPGVEHASWYFCVNPLPKVRNKLYCVVSDTFLPSHSFAKATEKTQRANKTNPCRPTIWLIDDLICKRFQLALASKLSLAFIAKLQISRELRKKFFAWI